MPVKSLTRALQDAFHTPFIWFPSSGLGTAFSEAPLHFPDTQAEPGYQLNKKGETWGHEQKFG